MNYPHLVTNSILFLYSQTHGIQDDEDNMIVELQLNEMDKTKFIYGDYGTGRDYLKLTK